MSKASLMAVALVASGLLGGTARADDTTDDVRCLLVSLSIAAMPDPAMQANGTLSSMYWMGRLDGRTPTLDLESKMTAEIRAMTRDDFSTAAARCGTALAARGQVMRNMGHDMQSKEPPSPASPPAPAGPADDKH